MPRPNQPRSIASEDALARRIGFEREARGWSPQGLAARMTKAGCPIQASAIYKIEKGDPPRRITVDELVAFSRVFALPVDHLLLPPELVVADELAELVIAWDQADDAVLAAREQEASAWDTLRAWIDEHPEHLDKVEQVFRHWSEQHFDDDHDFRVAHRMWKLTGDDKWRQRTKVLMDEALS